MSLLVTQVLATESLFIQDNSSYELSIARGVSGDGSTVIGSYHNLDIGDNFDSGFIDYGSFKWEPQGGWISLGELHGGSGSVAYDVNANGSVVVGSANDGAASGELYGNGIAVAALSDLPGNPSYVVQAPINDLFLGEIDHAYRWNKEEGMVWLGELIGGEEFVYLASNPVFNGNTLGGLTALGVIPTSPSEGEVDVISIEQITILPDYVNSVIVLNEGFTPLSSSEFEGTQDEYKEYIDSNSHLEAPSRATGVSDDGSVIVGSIGRERGFTDDPIALLGIGVSTISRPSPHGGVLAFRWTESEGMTSLGSLVAGGGSYATGVSGDGRVVVGSAGTAAYYELTITSLSPLCGLSIVSDEDCGLSDLGSEAPPSLLRAFRWTEEEGMVALSDEGSSASAVNYDGSVIVGRLGDHAARWTQASGMVDLGVLASYTSSRATDVNRDGSVVVGNSGRLSIIVTESPRSIELTTEQLGFRWTESTGMQSINDWLSDNGVAVGDITAISAEGVSDDGQTVVGTLDSYEAYIARVSPLGSGLFKLNDLHESIGALAVNVSGSLRTSGLTINGAHSRPMSRRVDTGKQTMWLAGDWGRDRHNGRDGDNGLAEIGGGYNFGSIQLNVSLGKTWANQNTELDGHVDIDGHYLMVEGIFPMPKIEGLYATVGAYGHWGDADIRRGYLNAGLPDSSSADADTDTWGLRLRLDWENAYAISQVQFTPYADLSYSDTHMDSYTETGGGVPAVFNSRDDSVTELRLGLNGAMPLANTSLQLVANIEAAHRFDNQGAGTSGQLLGLFEFDLEGQDFDSTWLKGGVGVEGQLGDGKAFLMLNGTTEGEMLSSWVAASYQIAF
jgi:uncharacterized membrane protein